MAAIYAWNYFTHQTEWKAYLQDLVSNNDTALLKSIVIIDNLQTEYERKAMESIDDNNVGWTKQDAKEMGEIANKVRSGDSITKGEMAKSRNKMKKYWRQLMMVSKSQQSEKERRRIAAEEERKENDRLLRAEQFRQYSKAIYECSEHGKACEYGICDECPVRLGLQMRLDV